ncbi:mannose-1-phosphate guanyltransferase [Pseudoalteromonas sp. NBT06-2]|nr:mannose-1-phosphate guanyltransferase [Pseudoalteromonas sp. NBT06-2]
MKAMILAAGKGTRVWPITKTIPKPMIPILRTPIMESLLLHFKKFGIEEIAVNTSYMGSEIENYFRDGNQFGVNLLYSYEGYMKDKQLISNALGSAGGMKKIQQSTQFFDDTFIVVCGDAWVDLDIQKAFESHKEKEGIATIILQDVPLSEVHKYGVVRRNEFGQILEFQEKPKISQAISTTINTGIYIFEPEIFDYIPIDKAYDIGSELFPKLAKLNVPFYGVDIDFQWADVGGIKDIWRTTSDILTKKIVGYPIPGKQVTENIWCGLNVDIDLSEVNIQGPVYIGSGTIIKKGVTIIGPVTIGAYCVIEQGAILERCSIDDYTWISEVVNLKDKVIFGEYCIDHGGEYVELQNWQVDWAINDSRNHFLTHTSENDLYRASLAVANIERSF